MSLILTSPIHLPLEYEGLKFNNSLFSFFIGLCFLSRNTSPVLSKTSCSAKLFITGLSILSAF